MKKPFRSSAGRVLLALGCLSVLALVAVPGVSQAATKAHGHTSPFAGKDYVALGDSYSVGYQPVPSPEATSGYTGYVATKLKMAAVEDFGCGGATTESILTYTGICGVGGTYAPPAVASQLPAETPGDTQVQNAVNFIDANPGQVGLVTVSISGNDVTSCVSTPSPITCVLDRLNGTVSATYNPSGENIGANVTSLVGSIKTALDASGDSSAPIVGLTYPDVIMGEWVNPGLIPADASASQSLAGLSITAFDSFLNPDLNTAYTSVTGGKFVNVTAQPQFGGNGTGISALSGQAQVGLSKKYAPTAPAAITIPKGTKVPASVADICKYTYYCTMQNIHANTKGYTFIGKEIVAALK